MLLQASSAAGGADVLVSEILPQLLPLFTCTAAQRKLYGCSEPAAPHARAGASIPLLSGESTGQSMRQALEAATRPAPGAPVPPGTLEVLPSIAVGLQAIHLELSSAHCSAPSWRGGSPENADALSRAG